jgi:molecular chaperone DnaK
MIDSQVVFGIDLGTTNTVISYFKEGVSKILTDGVFKLIPSKVYISPENKIYCGNYIPTGSKDIINSFKIEIGNDISYTRNDKIYKLSDILNIFINHIKSLINKKFTNLNKLTTVITVPSNFSDTQREIIRTAFINNEFDIIRIVNEPSAAALAYGLNQEGEKKIMVIDTGGGTMDITILQKDDNFFEVVHSIGLNDLGGNNFTQVIVNDIIKKNPNIKDNDTIFYSAQRMKEKLSYLENFQVNLKPQLGFDSFYELTEKEFNKLSNKLLSRIDELISDLLKQYTDIEYFVLVGGSSKMKILKEKIYDITRKKPWSHPNLESVVSEGASLYAAIITGLYKPHENVLLVDILPLSLGVATVDGNFSIIVPKNTPLPVKRSQKYTTDSPGDSTIKIKIYQGERKIADKNNFIGEIEFDKVSNSGMPVIDISFKVDLNGIINVIILDKKSGMEKNILIKDIPKFDENALANILKEAEINNEADEEMTNKLQRTYIIQTKIENALINLNINDLLSEETKKDIREQLNIIEESLGEMTNTELLDMIAQLDTKYSGLIQTYDIEDNDDNNEKKMDDLEKVLLNELKADVSRRANLLLAQNPEWSDFITPLLEDLELSNLSYEYLEDKLKILKELQDDETFDRDYKEELKNLCIYIKNEIDENQVDLTEDKKQQLVQLITSNLELLESSDESIIWEDKLKEFNNGCESIYSKKDIVL